MKIRVSGPDEEGAVVVVKLVGDAWPPTGHESLGTSTTGLLRTDRSGTGAIVGGGVVVGTGDELGVGVGGGVVGTGVAVGTGEDPGVGAGTEVGDSAEAGTVTVAWTAEAMVDWTSTVGDGVEAGSEISEHPTKSNAPTTTGLSRIHRRIKPEFTIWFQ